MFDRYDVGKRAILVYVCFLRDKNTEDLQEFKSLASSAKLEIMEVITANPYMPNPKYFIGKGKAIEIIDLVKKNNATIVLFNRSISPTQQRNLEYLFECRVIDHTELILNIFSQRARTYEGKLQVELAQLRYLTTRLVRGWTHLERQKGGIGLRGPGETQLETDRRLLRDRISQVCFQLEKIKKQREQGRHSRMQANIPTISLVGYTNAGKSTLFNQLTGAQVYVADQPFSTLDTTLRRFNIANIGKTVLSDTVGFIRRLPHDLIASFKATLQETKQATLLLHIVDAADIKVQKNINAVNRVLEEIGSNKIPTLLVMNKVDMIKNCKPHIDRDEKQKATCIWLSAKTGIGIPLLFQALTERLSGNIIEYTLHLPLHEGKLRSLLYRAKAIKKEWLVETTEKVGMKVSMPIFQWNLLCKKKPALTNYIVE